MHWCTLHTRYWLHHHQSCAIPVIGLVLSPCIGVHCILSVDYILIGLVQSSSLVWCFPHALMYLTYKVLSTLSSVLCNFHHWSGAFPMHWCALHTKCWLHPYWSGHALMHLTDQILSTPLLVGGFPHAVPHSRFWIHHWKHQTGGVGP